jgi:hypothetical protein
VVSFLYKYTTEVNVMTLSFNEVIKRRLSKIAELFEEFRLQHYMAIQRPILSEISHHFGISNLNGFVSSPNGKKVMVMYRGLLITKYGHDIKNPKNPDFEVNSDEEKNYLVKSLIDILIKLLMLPELSDKLTEIIQTGERGDIYTVPGQIMTLLNNSENTSEIINFLQGKDK